MRVLVFICISFFCGISLAAPPDAAMRAASAFYDGVRIETLPNGLQVVLKTVPGTGVVTTMVAYKVGAADEDLDATGLSHYLEHLMFKGTDKLVPGDVDRLTQRNGGRNNAWTSEDLTVYHFQFAADRWEVALDIEADRMRNLRIDDKHEFRQEKGAVIAELDRNEDSAFDLEQKAILPLLFGAGSPYGHPVIGEKVHVRGADANVIKAYYDRWYHPNNAILLICGDFDVEAALAKVRTKFRAIPAGKLPERKTAQPVSRASPVRKELPSKFEVARMVMGFNGVKAGDADEAALEVVQTILSGGKTTRLYRTLVEDSRMASTAQASNTSGRFPGWFAIDVELLQGKSRESAEKIVLEQLARLAGETVSGEELNRAKRLLVSGEVFGKESVHALADDLAKGIAIDGLERMKAYLPAIQAVTAEDVRRVTRKYLDHDKRVVVWSIPKEGAGSKTGAGATPSSPRRSMAEPAGGGIDLRNTRRVVLPNGLTLLLLENHRLPIVSAQAFVRDVRLSEPADRVGVATLAGSLLDEGTTTQTGQQIAAAIEDVGGDLRLSPSGGSLRVLAADLPLGVSLLFECLTKPAFPQEAFERLREQMMSSIDELESEPDTKAERVYQEKIYGLHPLGRPVLGTKASLSKLTPQSCKEFHQTRFVPNRTIVAFVGDFDSEAVLNLVKKHTESWKPVESPAPKLPVVTKPDASSDTIFSMPDAAQLYIYLGHLGIRRTDPDYYKLLVMDYVLGTGAGFTDRLSAKLRDRLGLAYTVTANISSTAGEEPGVFTCYIGTYANKFAEVKAGFLEEINRIRDEIPQDREVEDAKNYLLGSLPFRFGTSGQVAEQLLQIERFGLGFGYLDEFRKAVAAVNSTDVRDAAKKYLDPQRMILVAAGPVDVRGRPLPPAK